MAAGADDRFADAVDELYALDPAEFTARRNALAVAARKAGATDQAKQITALRRPSRAAWILNQLSRSAPQLAAGFAELSAQLRDAHQALDGPRIRELTQQRRKLIDQTTGVAFTVAAVTNPGAALRDDVVATLGAVLADPEAAARFATGTLVTAEDQSGFGPVATHLVSVPTGSGREPKGSSRTAPESIRVSARESREEIRRREAIAKAELAVASAREAKNAADDAAALATETVHQLGEQLADARRREDDALLDARHADLALQKAQQILDGRTHI